MHDTPCAPEQVLIGATSSAGQHDRVSTILEPLAAGKIAEDESDLSIATRASRGPAW